EGAHHFLWIMLGYALLFVAVIALWRIDVKRHPFPADMVYYPVSPPKFIAMFLLTLGIYGVYWFYKNWRYVKLRDQSSIMPVARGIFSLFWYYPLYEDLREDSIRRYGKPLLPPLAVGGVLAVAYLLFSLADGFSDYQLALTVPVVLLLLPLVNYINH